MREFYTIAPSDVGKHYLKAFGQVRLVSSHWGRTMPDDVGRRVYEVSPGVLQIENREQWLNRINGTGEGEVQST